MKRIICLSLLTLMLAGCGLQPAPQAPMQVAQADTATAQDVALIKSQLKGVIKLYFRYLDENKDGKVSKKELARRAPAPFWMRPYFDKDQDGYLSEDELLQMMASTVQVATDLLYAAFDTDFNGKVTRDDIRLIPFAKYVFTVIDKNEDGVISKAEFEKFVTSFGLIKSPF